MSKKKTTEKAKEGRSTLGGYYKDLKGALDKVSPELQEEASKLLGDFPDIMDRASQAEAIGTSLTDLVSTGISAIDDLSSGKDVGDIVKEHAGEVLENTVGTAVDQFLDKYADYEGDLLDCGLDIPIGPFFGCLNVDIGFSVKVSTALNAKRKAAAITATASLSGQARVSVGLSIGFKVATFDCSIGGGIQGGPNIEAQASLTLAASGTNLIGSVNPATIEVDFAAELYFAVPSLIPEDFVEWAAEQLGLGNSGNKILYPLGSINVITVTTPSYSITFEITAGRFSGATKKGEFKVELNDKIKNAAESVYDALYRAVTELPQRALEAVGEAVEGAIDLVKDGAQEVEDVAQKVIDESSELIDEVKAAAEEAAQEVAEVAQKARDYAEKKARWLKQEAEKKAKEIADAVLEAKDYAEAKAKELAEDAERIAREAAQKVEDAVDELGEAAQDAYKKVESAVDDAYDSGREIASDIGDALGDAADSVGSVVSDAYDTISNWSLF